MSGFFSEIFLKLGKNNKMNIFKYILGMFLTFLLLAVLAVIACIFVPYGGYIIGAIVLISGSMSAAILPVICIPWLISSMMRKYISNRWFRGLLLLATHIWMFVALVFTLYFVYLSLDHQRGNLFVTNFLIGCATLAATLIFSPMLILKLFPVLLIEIKEEPKVWAPEAKIELLRKEALQVDDRDMTSEEKVELGRMYQHADGVARDYEKAKCLYQEAIALGDDPQAVVAAKNHLAFMYLHGRGVEVNYAEAKRLCEEVVQQNAVVSETEFAMRYLVQLEQLMSKNA